MRCRQLGSGAPLIDLGSSCSAERVGPLTWPFDLGELAAPVGHSGTYDESPGQSIVESEFTG